VTDSIETALSTTLPVKTSELNKGAPKDALLPTSAGQQIKEDQARVDEAVTERDAAVKDRPKYPELLPEPKMEESDSPTRGYVSAIGIIGALSSAFARHGATGAMNAAAGVLGALKAGDVEAYKKNYDTWKTKNENALKLFSYQNDTYKDILNAKNKSVDERIAELRANAAAFKDDNMMQLLASRNPAIIEDLLAKSEAARQKAQETANKVQEGHEKRLAYLEGKIQLDEELKAGKITQLDYAKAIKDLANTATKGGETQGQVTWSNEAISSAVEAMHQGRKLSEVTPGLSAKNPNRDAVMNAYAKKYPNDDQVKQQMGLVQKTSASRAAGTTTIKVRLASNILDSSIPSMIEAAKKVGLKASTDINTVYNTIKKHGSNKDLENFSTQLRAVTTDYAQFIGRGAITVHSDEEALKILQDNMGVRSLEGFKDAVAKERGNVEEGIEKTLDTAAGGSSVENKAAPSQEDLEHTAKLHNMTVDEVKKKLGIE